LKNTRAHASDVKHLNKNAMNGHYHKQPISIGFGFRLHW